MSMMGSRHSSREVVLCGLFTALIAVGAFIRIPIPMIPFTLQLFFVTMAGLLLGARGGAISSGLYVVLGLLGLPIFTEGGGLGYVFKPTFGYLLGFVVGGYVIGKIAHDGQPTMKRLLVASYVGMAVVYVMGLIYFYGVTNWVLGMTMPVKNVLLYGFILVVPGDIILMIMAAGLAKRMLRDLRW